MYDAAQQARERKAWEQGNRDLLRQEREEQKRIADRNKALNKEMSDGAQQLVHEVLEGKHKDFTRGALYFVHVKTNTNWLKKSTHTCTIGNHKFFK